MDRIILHVDANSFYASVCCVDNPIYIGLPLAICGRQEERHGIVLAATCEAKKLGIKTGMTISDARKICRSLIIQPPDYPQYMRFSRHLRKIYEEYTPQVESFGLDECWLDISNPGVTLKDGERLAYNLRQRVREELGITVSVGVSYNKIYAKLGSDMRKPDATTVISESNHQELVYPLPVSDLLYVGKKAEEKLAHYGIGIIGDLANASPLLLDHIMGKNGLTLRSFARGEDQSPVMTVDERMAVKSVGNSATLPHDVTTEDEAAAAIYMLSESVAARIREGGLRARCISISVRDTKLICASCQKTIDHTTALAGEIAKTAISLFRLRYADMLPLRSMGISCSSLVPDDLPVQMDLLGKAAHREKEHALACAVDDIRRRWGHLIIQRGVELADPMYASVNPKEEHLIHPVSYFNG